MKVTIFVTRGEGVLVFHHDRSGVQIPAGTLEPNERPLDGATRELREETGLEGLHLTAIGQFEEDLEVDGWGFLRERAELAPDGGTVGPGWIRLLERMGDRALIDAGEVDADVDPPQMLTSLPGWIDSAKLLPTWRRYFFRAEAPASVPESWSRWVADGGGCEFRFFWLGLEEAADRLLGLQRPWLTLLRARDRP